MTHHRAMRPPRVLPRQALKMTITMCQIVALRPATSRMSEARPQVGVGVGVGLGVGVGAVGVKVGVGVAIAVGVGVGVE